VRLSGAKVDSTLTDAQGYFFFDSLAYGTYTITIDHPGATLFAPVGGSYTVELDSLNRRIDSLNFGVFVASSIGGSIFNDVNWSGLFDAGDSVLSNWPVSISGPVDTTIATDSLGNYSFTGLGPGTYTLRESLLPQWTLTAPPSGSSYSIVMRSGLDTTGPAFGNAYFKQFVFQTGDELDGWMMMSLPYRVSNTFKDSLFPQAISKAFIFDSMYEVADSIPYGEGFWLKFPPEQNVTIAGIPLTSVTIQVHKGWNMIGSIATAVPVAGMYQMPSFNLMTPLYRYDGGWIISELLIPGKAYWAKASTDGILILQSTTQVQKKKTSNQLK
jgi:hypothetical protein